MINTRKPVYFINVVSLNSILKICQTAVFLRVCQLVNLDCVLGEARGRATKRAKFPSTSCMASSCLRGLDMSDSEEGMDSKRRGLRRSAQVVNVGASVDVVCRICFTP